MTETVYLDGAFLPRAEARIAPDDRGFLFGDGVYEMLRALRGSLFEAEAHFQRLRNGLSALQIEAGERVGSAALHEIARTLLRENGLAEGDATVYLQVTRGAAARAHAFPLPAPAPTFFAYAAPFKAQTALQEGGARAVTLPDGRWARCDLKTTNLLANVLVKQQATERSATEGIMIRDGLVTEGSHTNVFAVVSGCLRTAPLSTRILPGVTRHVVLGLAAELGVRTTERAISASGLTQAEEIFLTGTTTDIIPVVVLDGRPVRDGRPGPITRALQRALAARMAASREEPLPQSLRIVRAIVTAPGVIQSHRIDLQTDPV